MKKIFLAILGFLRKPKLLQQKLEILKLLPHKLEKLDLWYIEKNFDDLKDKTFLFSVPTRDVKNGILVDLAKKTLGFQKNYVPYNFTILEFSDDCLFCKIKESRCIQGRTFVVQAKEKIMRSKNGQEEVGSLTLTVLKIE